MIASSYRFISIDFLQTAISWPFVLLLSAKNDSSKRANSHDLLDR